MLETTCDHLDTYIDSHIPVHLCLQHMHCLCDLKTLFETFHHILSGCVLFWHTLNILNILMFLLSSINLQVSRWVQDAFVACTFFVHKVDSVVWFFMNDNFYLFARWNASTRKISECRCDIGSKWLWLNACVAGGFV